jgi:phosphoglycerol transferase
VARFRDIVNAQLPANENHDSSLGVIGSLGFLALCGWLFVRRRSGGRAGNGNGSGRLLHDLSMLNLSAILLATTGGFGVLVALIISPKIRAYNRISVYIAFFSLFAVVVGLDYLYRRYGEGRARRALWAVGLAVLLGLGVLDQTNARVIPSYATNADEYRSDAAFVRRLQARLLPGAMIFQLPLVPFPEHPPIHRMHDYDHARGYLHASHLRWSYGAMVGREGEAWQRLVAAQPTPELLGTLVAAGFSGLYLNRDGYPDRGAKLGAEIESALGQPPLRSTDGRLLFFNLTAFGDGLRAAHTTAQWDAKREAALYPLLVLWRQGCSDLEGTAEHAFRWCAARGAWRLINGAQHTKRVTLEMWFASSYEGDLWIEGPLLSAQLRIGSTRRAFSQTISVPPGQHTLAFACDAPPALPPGDRRELVFRVGDFRVVPAEP